MKRTSPAVPSLKSLVFLTVLAASILFLACPPKGDVKVGATAFLTGKLATVGQSIKWGLELAAYDLNQEGGIAGRKLELILEDEGDTPQQATNAVQKLINVDRVPIILGPISSSSVMAVAPIANEKKVVLLSPGAASPNITYAGDFVFRNRAAGTLEATEIAEFAYDRLKLRSVIVFEINEDYGSGFRKVFQQEFEGLGGKVVLVESYNQGDADFRTQLAKFKSFSFDGLYVIGVANGVGTILKQARELGIKATIITNNMENPELIRIAGKAADGIFFPIPLFDPQNPDPAVRAFVDSYTKKYGQAPDLFAANAYDALRIAKYAIEKGGYSGEKIRDVLYKMKDFPAVSGGKVSFDSNGDVVQPLVIKTVRDGKFVVVE